MAALLVLAAPALSGCFTTLETAKTVNGASLTVGAQRYVEEDTECDAAGCRSVERGHYFLVVMPRFGVAAKPGRFGFDFGVRVVSDVLDHPASREAGYLVTVEPKLQFPPNPVADIAIGMELLVVRPTSLSLFVSKDVLPWLTPYSEFKAQLFLWSLLEGDRATHAGRRDDTVAVRAPLRRGRAVRRFGDRFRDPLRGGGGIPVPDAQRLRLN